MEDLRSRDTEKTEKWRRTAEAILKEMPPPSIPIVPEGQTSDTTKYKNRLDFSTADAWQKCAEAIEQHDADECKAHREEIDTLLVFVSALARLPLCSQSYGLYEAGLFSAVLTAFTIESYQWLQDDPDDAIIALLSQLVEMRNSTHSAPVPTGLPAAVSARINAYWFLSLTLSLSAALVAILCKQWVREFERHANQSHRQYIGIRQMKLEGFEGWGVASIVTVIPLLLQTALGLFALGLIELLWKLHRTVAIVVLVPTGAALLFYALTTLLPALQYISSPLGHFISRSQCPFKSPQSMLTLRALMRLSRVGKLSRHLMSAILRWGIHSLLHCIGLERHTEHQGSDDNSSQLDTIGPDYIESGPPHVGRRTDHLASWTALDGELNRAGDAHEDMVQNVSFVPSCFRGFGWLRDHIDQPAMNQQIFLAVWDILIQCENSPWIASWKLRNGIDRLSHPADGYGFFIARPDSRPISPFRGIPFYAERVGLQRDLVAELLVHHLGQIDGNTIRMILRDDIFFLDQETLHLMLRKLLVSRMTNGVPDAALILVVGRFLHVLSRQEIASVIAAHFQVLHSRSGSRSRDFDHLQELFRFVSRCLGVSDYRDHNEPAAQRATATDSALSALVLELDQYFAVFAARTIVQPWHYNFAVDLARDTDLRGAYLGLLANAPNGPVSPLGDMSAAETRFFDTVVQPVMRAEESGMRERQWSSWPLKEPLRGRPPEIAAQHTRTDPTMPSYSEDAASGGDVVIQETENPGSTED